jgi:hypothetical protein
MVDAAFYLKDLGEVYFFSVDKYCRVRWEPYTFLARPPSKTTGSP